MGFWEVWFGVAAVFILLLRESIKKKIQKSLSFTLSLNSLKSPSVWIGKLCAEPLTAVTEFPDSLLWDGP